MITQEPAEKTEMSPGDTVRLSVAKAGAVKPAETKSKTSTVPAVKKTEEKKPGSVKGKSGK